MKHYDIFISYRRSSYDTANLIATRLKSAGYSVFFDMETLRSGKFNEQLYKVIDSCKDFVLVLPPDALDRCTNEDDWIRLEVCRAISGKKNIIPVMLNGFTWPKPMPNGMEELSRLGLLGLKSKLPKVRQNRERRLL
ncbi:MAG: toll/interleukin-1 receptor domain-containing protein, partial [Prevotella sp.]|nr:toll/interleukin-1 receptor domain-containing protein [Prevotella sp.]